MNPGDRDKLVGAAFLWPVLLLPYAKFKWGVRECLRVWYSLFKDLPLRNKLGMLLLLPLCFSRVRVECVPTAEGMAGPGSWLRRRRRSTTSLGGCAESTTRNAPSKNSR